MQPESLTEAEQYIGRRVRRSFKEGTFTGKVVSVEFADDLLVNGRIKPGPIFHIRYEDSDTEEYFWCDMLKYQIPDVDGDAPNRSAKRRRLSADPGSASRRRAAPPPPPAEPSASSGSSSDSDSDASEGDGDGGARAGAGARSGSAAADPGEGAEAPEGAEGGEGGASDVEMGEEGERGEEGEAEGGVAAALTGLEGGEISVRRQGLAGHIARIRVMDFMCHENFELEFGPHVNIISGTNGSGKSAVLQALQCCLGASARDTGRAPRMEDLIRNGCDEARVQVTLWNCGEDAFQPALMGNQITIERRVSRPASAAANNRRPAPAHTTWKVYTSAMKPVPRASKRMVEDICDALTINAVNPIAVLTQDAARTFLSSASTPRNKFDLFMSATLLDVFKRNLARADASVADMQEHVRTLADDYKAKRKEVRGVARQLEKLRGAGALVEARARAEAAVLWRAVEDREADIAANRAALQALQGRRAEIEAAAAQVEARLLELDSLEVDKRALMSTHTEEHHQLLGDTARLRDQVKAAKKEAATLKREQHRAERKVAGTARDLDALRESQLPADGPGRQAIAARLTQTQEEVEAVTEARADADAKLAELQALRPEADARLHSLKDKAEKLRHRLAAERQQLEELRRQRWELNNHRSDSVARFPAPWASKLAAEVAAGRGGFEVRPIGPLGAHVVLTDPKWGRAVEVACASVLDRWLVNSMSDLRKLEALAQSVGVNRNQLRVTVRPLRQRRYALPSQRRPHGRFTTLSDVMVAEPTLAEGVAADVTNALLDEANAEAVVLTEEEGVAQDITHRGVAGPHIRTVYTVAGNRHSIVGRSTRKVESSGPVIVRLGADTSAVLVAMDQEIATVEANILALTAEIDATAMDADGARRALDDLMGSIRALQKKKTTLHTRMTLLSRQSQDMAAELAAQEGGSNEAEVQEADMMQAATCARIELEGAKGAVAEATERVQLLETQMQAKSSEAEEVMRAMERTEAEVIAVGGERVRAQGAINQLNSLTGEALNAEQALKSKVEEQEALLVLQLARAEAQCARAQGRAAVQALAAEALERARAKAAAAADSSKAGGRGRGRGRRGGGGGAGRRSLDEEDLDDLAALEAALLPMLATAWRAACGALATLQEDAGGSEDELQALHDKLSAEAANLRTQRDCLAPLMLRLTEALERRRTAYAAVFNSIDKGVRAMFMAYMHKRGHRGKIEINEGEGTLKLLVKVNGLHNTGRDNKAVTDLKQLSGGERSYTTVAFIAALGEWTENPFRAMDEFDCFMDEINRRVSMALLINFAILRQEYQFVFLTPQDLQAVEHAKHDLERERNAPIADGFVRVVQLRPARERGA